MNKYKRTTSIARFTTARCILDGNKIKPSMPSTEVHHRYSNE